MLNLAYLSVCLAAVLSGHLSEAQVGACTKLDSCSCLYEDGTKLNLSSLTRDDGVPAFSNVTDSDKQTYVSWNPCSSFTIEGTECTDVAICVMREGIPNTLFYDVGKEDSATFSYNVNGSLILTYTSDQGDFKRSAEIHLQCLKDAKFDFFVYEGEQEPNNDTIFYKIVLASRYACGYAPNITPANTDSGSTSSLSGGTIFIIVLFSLIGAYLVFGMAFQVFVKKESGRRIFPNHEFWCNIPSLITGGCKSMGTKKDKGAAYDSI